MTAVVLALVLAAPTRLVVGIEARDLRQQREAARVEALMRAARGVEVRRLPFALVLDVDDAAFARHALRARPDVRWIQEEVRLPVRVRAPNDPLWQEEWHLQAAETTPPGAGIGVEAGWDLDPGVRADASSVRVAVVDDGFDLTHPDLAARFTFGIDYAMGLPPDADPTAGAGDYHGTQTAGVIAATFNNGLGVAGVCPLCTLVPVRLIGGGGPQDLYEIDSTVAAEAIVWAYEQGGADVINNSWGPPDGSPYDPQAPRQLYEVPLALAEALARAARDGRGGLGCVITWAAGNGGELVTYDRYASHPAVMAIGAVDAEARRTYYSDYGPPLWLVAPSGGDLDLPMLWTTDIQGAAGVSSGDYTGGFTGTSGASAVVAGVAALVLERYPNLTAAQVREALALGAKKVDAAHADYDARGHSDWYGFGRVDVAGALEVAASYTDDCTTLLELCGNGIDDNCDGTVDEASQCAPCIPDASVELCDGRDNNCDGRIDEGFACELTGRPICAPCETSSQCAVGNRCYASPFFAGSYCFSDCQTGAPCAPGFACNGDACVLVPTDEVRDCSDVVRCSQPEVCDGIDNDCNGIIDDIDATGDQARRVAEHCSELGVCAGYGVACIDGAWQCLVPTSWQAQETACDGLDNDCDGHTDEGCPKGGCSCRGTPSAAWPWALALLLLVIKRGLWRGQTRTLDT